LTTRTGGGGVRKMSPPAGAVGSARTEVESDIV
jgi:hypothetical protein